MKDPCITLPPSTPHRDLLPGDVMLWHGRRFKVISTKLSKSGKKVEMIWENLHVENYRFPVGGLVNSPVRRQISRPLFSHVINELPV